MKTPKDFESFQRIHFYKQKKIIINLNRLISEISVVVCLPQRNMSSLFFGFARNKTKQELH